MNMYLVDGQKVFLNKTLTDQNGKTMYLVTPIFEGVAFKFHPMEESSIDYEHEDNEIIVDKIFEKPPTKKIDKIIESKELEIRKITEAIGVLSITIKELENKSATLTQSISSKEFILEQMERTLASKQGEINDRHKKVESLIKDIQSQKDLLKKYEDKVAFIAIKVASLDEESSSKTMIDNDELKLLMERDHKLHLLETAGVDNWDGYSVVLNEGDE